MTTVDFALGQCRDVDLHLTPSFCAEIVVQGRVSKRYVSRLGGPSGAPDADDGHVERDGNDGRDLLIGDYVSVGLSHEGLTMSRTTYWPLVSLRKRINASTSGKSPSIDEGLQNRSQLNSWSWGGTERVTDERDGSSSDLRARAPLYY